MYIECGLLKTHLLPFFSKFNTVWGGRGGVIRFTNMTKKIPNTFDLNCREKCSFPFPQPKMKNLLVFHAMGNILREPQSTCSHSPVPFLCR